MPRLPRQKSDHAIFHVMCRSITEVDLFKDDDDKVKYLSLMRKYQKLYQFKVYGYCLMDNHAHFIIDVNGADISTIMHSVNFSYAMYFNKRHGRHGHLFQDRFKSKIINDERYLFALSAYIHNNPLNVTGYESCPEKYTFSSLSIYLGLKKDPFELVDTGFVMSLFGNNTESARRNYIQLVYRYNTEKYKNELEFKNEGTEYRSGRTILVRDISPDSITMFIAKKFNISDIEIRIKNSKENMDANSMLVVLMRCLCNYKCTDISRIIGNITESSISMLSSRGIGLISKRKEFKDIIREFISEYAA